MGNMFSFLDMANNYESRKVKRDDFPWGFISTANVTDARHPFETAVKHSNYNKGEIVIVAMYDSKSEAKAGHTTWVDTMTADKLPDRLVDVSTAGVAEFLDAVSSDNEHRIKSKESV